MHRRYDVGLEFRYRLLTSRGSARSGFGIVSNLSRGGALLQAETSLPVGSRVELFIKWPFRLQNVCPLDLVVVGRIVRAGDGRAAVHTESQSFRTRGGRFFTEETEPGKVLAVG